TAFAAVNFYVAKKEGKPVDWKKPLLTYSRPKGEYAGVEGFRVMLDFFVNVPLSPTGYRVRYSVDGEGPFDVTDWSPIWLEGLSDGEHIITLTLIDRRGKEVPGWYNRNGRKIVVKTGAASHH
ncbi:MAG: hypothetical protein HYY84_14590, partial [Deltaproteobacteria bacterium]|nr:hypothetical protein [Deltaproteobacteria bacterium]